MCIVYSLRINFRFYNIYFTANLLCIFVEFTMQLEPSIPFDGFFVACFHCILSMDIIFGLP